MKHRLVSVVGLFLSVGLLHAGSESIIKQKAKDLRDQNNARQGAAPPPRTPAQPPATVPQPTVPAAPLTAQQQALGRLQKDLTALRPGSEITPVQKQQLARSLAGVAQGLKPKPELTTRLADDLAAALGSKLLANPTRTKLLQNLSTALNAGRFAPAQVNQAVADTLNLLKGAGVDQEVASRVATSVRAMAEDLKAPVAK